MDQQLQTLQSDLSQLEIGSSTNLCCLDDFLKHEEFIDSDLKNFLRQEWKMLYDRGIMDSPLYQSEEVEKISLFVLKSWIQLEKYFAKLSHDNLRSFSNILISGAKGVGKTTLMKGLRSIIDENCIHVTTIFIDYETRVRKPLPSQILQGFNLPDSDFDQKTLCEYAKRVNKGVIFFGDEIQELYKNPSNIPVVTQILAIGKSGCAMGIVSGSSSNVRALAYKKVNDFKYLDYPSLINTVYKEKHLNPLRTENEIKQYLENQEKTIHMDSLDYSK